MMSILLTACPLSFASRSLPAPTEEWATTTAEEKELIDLFASMSEEEEKLAMEFLSLDWKETGTYSLSKSKSSLSVPEGYLSLVGEDAHKAIALNKEPFREHLEAVVYDENFENLILFESIKSGYVSLDDWKDIDPKALLETIAKNTEKANEHRKKEGGEIIHVTGWIQEPTLDRYTNTVYWAIEGESEENQENVVNSIALRLGREGFEKITWVTEKSDYSPFGGELDVMLRSHSFDPGSRYTDYTLGDKAAGYGIATLVAATIGTKVAKVGGIAVLFKKIGALVAAGVAAVLYKIKNIFRRKKKDDDQNESKTE